MDQAVQTRDLLTKDGHDIAILSGGSTGTYNIDSDLPGGHRAAGRLLCLHGRPVPRASAARTAAPVYTDFRPSLTVLTTVVSTTLADRVSVDAGTKSFATDVPHACPRRRAGTACATASTATSSAALTAEDGGKLPRLGDRLEFVRAPLRPDRQPLRPDLRHARR